MQETLDDTLQQLHEQIRDLGRLNESEREQLREAVTELQQSLDRFDVKSSDLAKRIHGTTTQFSEQYPGLAQTAGQVADILSQMGI